MTQSSRSKITRIRNSKVLLRSITHHVKDQNWFAVLLDFFIVVVGVFVGIQVSNWNDARTEREQERAFLGALKSDVVQSSLDLASYIESVESGHESLRQLAEFVDGQHDDMSTNDIDAHILYGLFWLHFYSPTDGTYNELLNSGRLGLIGDPELRAKLQELASEVKSLANNTAGIESMTYSTMDPILLEKTDFRGFTSIPSAETGYRIEWLDPKKDRRDYKLSLRTPKVLNVILYRARLDHGTMQSAMRARTLLEQTGKLLDRRIAVLPN